MTATTYVEAIRQGLREEMERDDRVFLLGEDIGAYGGAFKVTEGLLERFGEERVIDTPISEAGIVGAAVGAAMMGLRPVVEMQFADFISCAFDMIVNFAAKARYRTGTGVPLVVRGPAGGGVHGGPFHSQNPEAYFAHAPGLMFGHRRGPYLALGLAGAEHEDGLAAVAHHFADDVEELRKIAVPIFLPRPHFRGEARRALAATGQVGARPRRAHAKGHVGIFGIGQNECARGRIRFQLSQLGVERFHILTLARVSFRARADCWSAICSFGQSLISTCF